MTKSQAARITRLAETIRALQVLVARQGDAILALEDLVAQRAIIFPGK